ncbi:MAG: hypothetical protein JO107_01640 [Hyphomicrobiales bacterium]|nr:hypothetical protein [Hyphomicrobiales bacterium]MBV8661782.1 hypothetical protein [Hyphomicrobiales bacterium]
MSVWSNTGWGILAILAGGLLAVGAAEAQTDAPAKDAPAAAAQPKPKPKAAANQPRVDIVVTNSRDVPLTALLVAPSGSADSKKVAGPLGAGKKIVVHIAHDKACLFDLHGDYADGTTTDAEGVSLCKDKKINLIE